LSRLVRRALRIIDAVANGNSGNGWSISDISKATGIPMATVYRIVNTLEEARYLRQDHRTKEYYLGFRLLELGARVQDTLDPVAVCRSALIRLAEAANESSSLSMVDGNEAVRVGGHTVNWGFHIKVGERGPLHLGGSRRLLLAYMDEQSREAIINVELISPTTTSITDPAELRQVLATIREQGYALSHGERTSGVIGLAAPVWNHECKVVASIALSIPEGRFDKERQCEYIDLILRAGEEASRSMGYPGTASTG